MHEDYCEGFHLPEMSCEEATAWRNKERPWNCPNNPKWPVHNFQNGDLCLYGCGASLTELLATDNKN